MTVIAQQELQHDYNQVNWNELWQSDPGRAGLLEKQFQARNARIQGTLQDVGQRQMQARQQAEQAQKANEEKGKERQVQRLFELIPEWRDSDVLAKERAEMGAWVQKTGVDISDLDLTKASQVRLLRQAWQHETLQASKPAIEQRLREAPKLIKPGAAKQADAGDKSALLKNLKQQARGTGSNSTKAAAAWLVAQGLA
ncbi:MAG: hypothetical protein H7255_20710 [Ramlibacter sp.]|nr:hypothetical protein [Ramlibacter sp.]